MKILRNLSADRSNTDKMLAAAPVGASAVCACGRASVCIRLQAAAQEVVSLDATIDSLTSCISQVQICTRHTPLTPPQSTA